MKKSLPVDELARDGIDWTVVDRVMYVGGEQIPDLPAVGQLHDEHFVTHEKVTERGEIITEMTVIGEGNEEEGVTIWGQVSQGNPDIEATYGVHEQVVTEDKIRDAQSAVAAAEGRMAVFRRPPVVFSGGRLDPEAPVDIMSLIPGLELDVHLDNACREVRGRYFVTKVTGKHSDSDDEVAVDLSPSSERLDEEGNT